MKGPHLPSLATILLTLVSVALSAGALFPSLDLFRHPAFIILLSLLGALALAAAVSRRVTRRTVGYYLTHIAVVLVLAGSLADHLWSFDTTVSLPVSPDTAPAWHPIPGSGHEVAATGFQVTRYPPDYGLYKAVSTSATPPGHESMTVTDYEFVHRFRPLDNGAINTGPHGTLPPGSLKRDGPGDMWVPQAVLPDGTLLQALARVDRDYRLRLEMRHAEMEPGETRTADVRINAPATFDGWRFFLISYTPPDGSGVVIRIRRAPGRLTVFAGIFCLLGGVTLLSFRREEAVA